MDDILEKLQSVMSDPESMSQIESLAAMLGQQNDDESSSQSSESSDASDPGIDLGMIMQLTSLMGSTGQDEDAALLLALKPHLKEARQKKVDKAVKLLKLLTVWKTLRDTGLLKDFM